MELNKKVIIDFYEFFSEGKFDFLSLGKCKEWVLNNFPDPDGYVENKAVFNDNIWTYGNIELHFNEDKLFLIYSDYIDELDGGDSLELKKWILEENADKSMINIIQHLNSKQIDYAKKTNKDLQMVTLTLQSNIILYFYPENDEDKSEKNNDQNQYQLTAFALK